MENDVLIVKFNLHFKPKKLFGHTSIYTHENCSKNIAFLPQPSIKHPFEYNT